jgi:hypothetical protein
MSKTLEFIKGLLKESQVNCIEVKGKCQKCKCAVELLVFAGEDEISGNGGIIVGDSYGSKPQFKCTKCLGEDNGMISPTKCEVFTRVCGYLRPVDNFNKGKKAEFRERVNYEV